MPASVAETAAMPAHGGWLRLLLRLLRVKQWTKNLLLFAGAVFARQIFIPRQFVLAASAFLVFCLLSSSLYILNDLVDLDKDRKHPRKRLRPLASGAIAPATAIVLAAALGAIALALAWFLAPLFFAVAASYAVLTAAYSFFLKRLVIIDVMVLAMGFVLRAVAGAVAVNVAISPWLLVCTMSLALFLALGKRRQELRNNGDGGRDVLVQYTPAFLDQAITIATAAVLMSYSLYTFDSAHSTRLMLTIPCVVYGIFRYLLLIERHGEEPEEVLISDVPFIINILLWIAGSLAVIHLD